MCFTTHIDRSNLALTDASFAWLHAARSRTTASSLDTIASKVCLKQYNALDVSKAPSSSSSCPKRSIMASAAGGPIPASARTEGCRSRTDGNASPLAKTNNLLASLGWAVLPLENVILLTRIGAAGTDPISPRRLIAFATGDLGWPWCHSSTTLMSSSSEKQ